MHIDVPAHNVAGGAQQVRLQQQPDTCPRCHRSVHPRFLLATILEGKDLAQAIFRCTHHKCQEVFIATYKSLNKAPAGALEHELVAVGPTKAAMNSLLEAIASLSPSFVAIYAQVNEAESHQLDQLVGIGLRKALEFLIKDYAVSEHPGSEAEIRNTQLGPCISQYISDTNIKECAKRAAWLGNDETHYTRKWESKDVSDLKLLVKLTVNWIENVTLTKKYMAEMNAGKA